MTDTLQRYGLHRVIDPLGVLPQAAHKLRSSGDVGPSEVQIDVHHLNLDSASYRDFFTQHSGDVAMMKSEILEVISARGKVQNPRTGSGGMLVGTISDLGEEAAAEGFTKGDRVATLISLTATPLIIHDELRSWDGKSEVVETNATAFLPSVRAVHRLPDDLDERVALSILDVCGAPAFAKRLIDQSPKLNGDLTMLLLGGGKSAVLAAAHARSVGVRTIAVVPTEAEREDLIQRQLFDWVVTADARMPVEVRNAVAQTGREPDITLVCVNVSGCEHSALMSTAPGGSIVYFSMATSFSRVALGAESLCDDMDLYFGSGYLPGHADLALDLVRKDAGVAGFFSPKR